MNGTTTETGHRGLGWRHGCLTIQRLGAMLAPVTFVLPGGRQVSPLHIAPWADDPGSEELPGILRRLRGEWPCVPFGYTMLPDGFTARWSDIMAPAEPDEEAHGHSANNDWVWEAAEPGSLRLSLDYPEASPVRRVERAIRPDVSAPAIDLEFRIEVKRPCQLPLGLHPVLRLPVEAGKARLEPGDFDHGLTHPGTVEPGAALFAQDRAFDSLEQVPSRAGGVIDASRVPLQPDVEELLQLNGVDGRFALANNAENYRLMLSWNPDHFPSLLLWFSNSGRKMEPWSGRHVAIGVEPICSPFGLGPATARADNPIAASGTPTALSFQPDRPFVTRYRIEAEPL